MSNSKKNQISRRSLLKGAAALTGAAAVSGLAPALASEAPSVRRTWDYETDVLILGLGGAGMAAGVEARDIGAEVLILEKQAKDRHYPNTRMSGGIFHCPDPSGEKGKAALKAYAKAMLSGGNISGALEGEMPDDIADGVAQAWAELSPQNTDWLKKLDPDVMTLPVPGFKSAAFPDFPGAEDSGYKVRIASYTFFANPNNPTKDAPKGKKAMGEAFFTALREGVGKRNIPILYETSAVGLIMNEKAEVIGAAAKTKDGKEIACRARRGVIIATGGYEYNKEMRRAFLEGSGVEGWAFYGSPANTGDGIEIAMKAGAGLMKPGNVSARVIMAVPIRINGMKMGIITDSVGSPHSIVVDNYGNRYASETLITTDPSRYFFYKEAVRFDIRKLIYPRSPSWMIFDQKCMSEKTITYLGLSTVGYGFVPWSKDNMDAVNRGWILKADTMEELAKKIKAHPENRTLMDPAALAKTVERYNAFSAKGADEDFSRSSKTLAPLEKAPYYALPLYPGGPNTKGGIAANAKREVLDWSMKPIPGLYAAGEVSSVVQFVYQGGANLTECLVFGRIAGRYAAARQPSK